MSRKYLLLFVLSTDRLSMRAWISSSTLTDQSHTWMSPLLLLSLVSAARTKPGLMAKRAEKGEFDRYPHINLVPFILETTGPLGPHARKFISNLMRDADNPPLAIRDTWSVCSTVPYPTTTHSRRYVISGAHCHSQFLFCRLHVGPC